MTEDNTFLALRILYTLSSILPLTSFNSNFSWGLSFRPCWFRDFIMKKIFFLEKVSSIG